MFARRYLVAGGTGLVGSELLKALVALPESEISVLTRNPRKAQQKFSALSAGKPENTLRFFAQTSELDSSERFDAVIHLAGANIFMLPWFEARKSVLRASRLGIAAQLQEFIARATHKPQVWIQASAVGFYPFQSKQPLLESAEPGTGFAAELCQEIEQSVAKVQALQIRAVALRLGLVLASNGGVFAPLKLATQIAGGAVLGSGQQKVAWIHIKDVIAAILHLLANDNIRGPVNLVAPESPTNQGYTQAIAKSLRRPAPWRVPAWTLRASLGKRADLLLEGATIVPEKLHQSGFKFQFPDLVSALKDLTA